MAYKKSRCPKGSRRLKKGSKCVKISSRKTKGLSRKTKGLSRKTKGLSRKKKSSTIRSKSCSRQSTKKYTKRSSPAYPANECCGQVKKGNDGLMYRSESNKKGICRWVKV